jgi:hypothetical protein
MFMWLGSATKMRNSLKQYGLDSVSLNAPNSVYSRAYTRVMAQDRVHQT